MTHCVSASETAKVSLMVGSATWTMEKSTTSKKTAATIRPKIIREWEAITFTTGADEEEGSICSCVVTASLLGSFDLGNIPAGMFRWVIKPWVGPFGI